MNEKLNTCIIMDCSRCRENKTVLKNLSQNVQSWMYYDNIQFNLSNIILIKPAHVREAERFVGVSAWTKGVCAIVWTQFCCRD